MNGFVSHSEARSDTKIRGKCSLFLLSFDTAYNAAAELYKVQTDTNKHAHNAVGGKC